MLNLTLEKLEEQLNNIIKSEYAKGFRITSQGIFYEVKNALNTNMAFYRSGTYGEYYIDTPDKDLRIYLMIDFNTGKKKKNIRIIGAKLEINVYSYGLADTSFKAPRIAIFNEGGYHNDKIDIEEESKTLTFGEIIQKAKDGESELYKKYRDEINGAKIQGIVKHIMLFDANKEKLFLNMLGNEMAARFKTEPLKGDVANYIVDNLIIEVTKEEAEQLLEKEKAEKELKERINPPAQAVIDSLKNLNIDELTNHEIFELVKLLPLTTYALVRELNEREEK